MVAKNQIVIFWDVMHCSLADAYGVSEEPVASIFNLKMDRNLKPL
jgi:hypothetical protein